MCAADKKPETTIGIDTQATTMPNNTLRTCNMHRRDVPEAIFDRDAQGNLWLNCKDLLVSSFSLLSKCVRLQYIDIT